MFRNQGLQRLHLRLHLCRSSETSVEALCDAWSAARDACQGNPRALGRPAAAAIFGVLPP
jgi:hypothetical protein